jgi:hypothetical protein
VHEIAGWRDLRRRLEADRRCYAFFHPALENEPIIFVEVALARGICTHVQPLLDPNSPVLDPKTANCAMFYSITNCQEGLRGVSFGNLLIKQGAKLVTSAEDVIEELPTPVRAALVQAEQPEAEQRNLLAAASLNGSAKKIYELLSAEAPRHIDDIVESSDLNSSDVLATLFDLEMKGMVRQMPGKQFSKVML